MANFFRLTSYLSVLCVFLINFLKSDIDLNSNHFYLISENASGPIQLKKNYQHNDLFINLMAEDIKLTTTGGLSFTARYFNNNSDKVIVLGQGFPGEMEAMQDFIPFLGDGFDYIAFDYRWKDLFRYVLNPITICRPTQRIFYDEQEEIITVVNFLKSKKNYKEIIGLGQCYSSFLFVVTQAKEQLDGRSLFDRLILESCWYSLKEFALCVGKDPGLVANPQYGGSEFLKWICSSQALYGVVEALTKFFPDINIESYASKLKDTPILFIHGMNDKLISTVSFAQVWNAVSSPKVALLTPHRHVDNLQHDGVMTHACKTFLESCDIENFITKINNFS